MTAYSASLTVKNPDSDQGSHSTSTRPPPGTRILETYGRLSLSFEPNRGQTDGQVQFLSRGWGYTLFLTANQAVLSFSPPLLETAQPNHDPAHGTLGGQPKASNHGSGSAAWQEQLLHRQRGRQMAQEHSYLCPGPVRDVYPGVDLIYYGHHQQLEYDFILAPGADPNTITLRFQGADQLEVDAQGDLVIHSGMGEVRFQEPLVYQEVDGIRQQIPGGLCAQR